MKLKRVDKKSRKSRYVSVDVQSSELLVAIVDPADGQDSPTVRTRTVVWRREADSLRCDLGREELTEALRSLAAEERLQGESLHIALGNDHCVTRVVAGENATVRQELRRLDERSAWYLSLGAGEKLSASHVLPIDAKAMQGWMTVVNRATLTALHGAVTAAGMKIGSMEHSLVAACRTLGHAGLDKDEPAMLVELGEQRVELGVSCNGRLLLDYRPGGSHSQKDDAAQTVASQLTRLRRYCTRQFKFVRGDIRRTYLVGSHEAVAEAKRQFRDRNAIEAQAIDPHDLLKEWRFEEQGPLDPRFLSALGTAMAAMAANSDEPAPDRGGPNLMDELHKEFHLPIRPMLTKLAAPAAAMLVVALLIFTGSLWQRARCARVESQLAKLEGDQSLVHSMRMELTAKEAELKHFQHIRSSIVNPHWPSLVAVVGAALPEDAWLESIAVDRDGVVVITGPCRREDSVFTYIQQLRTMPLLTDVALESTQPISVQGDIATRFDIKARLASPDAETNGEAEDGTTADVTLAAHRETKENVAKD